jgi:CRISPR-associated protein Cas1
LVITNKLDKTHLEFYPHRIEYDAIILERPTGAITFEAIRWLMAHNVSVIILHWSGAHSSTILPNEAKNAKQRLAQYVAHANPTMRNEN